MRDEHNIGERATFYICRLYTSAIESGGEYRKIKEPKGELADWIKLIIGDERGIIMASKNNKAIEKANKENKALSMDKQMQEDYWFEQKELYAENTRISAATDKGIEIGEREATEKIVKNLLSKGVKIEDIIEITELTKEEVEEISKRAK